MNSNLNNCEIKNDNCNNYYKIDKSIKANLINLPKFPNNETHDNLITIETSFNHIVAIDINQDLLVFDISAYQL